MFLEFYCKSLGYIYVSVLEKYFDSEMLKDFLCLPDDVELCFESAILDDATGALFADDGILIIYYQHGEMFYG